MSAFTTHRSGAWANGDGWDEPRLPLVVRFRDTPAYQETLGSTRFVNGFVGLLGAGLAMLMIGHVLGVVELGQVWSLLRAIAELPDLFSVGLFALLALALLGTVVLVYVWVCSTLAGFRFTDDWGIEFRADGFVFLSGESGRSFVPWTNVARIERVPFLDYDQFVMVEPFPVPAKFGRPGAFPEVGFGQLDPHWRSGPIGAILRRHAPHLFTAVRLMPEGNSGTDPRGRK